MKIADILARPNVRPALVDEFMVVVTVTDVDEGDRTREGIVHWWPCGDVTDEAREAEFDIDREDECEHLIGWTMDAVPPQPIRAYLWEITQ